MINRFKVFLLLLLYFGSFIFGVAAVGPLANVSYGLGQVLGVWSLTALAFQLVLSSRSRLLERGVGLPNIMAFHSFNGRFLFFSVLLHPILIFGGLPPFSRLSVYYWSGVLAFGLIVLTLVTTLFVKLNYELWKVLHRVGYVIAILGFGHSFFSGSHIYYGSLLYFNWIFLLLLSLLAIISKQINLRSGKEYRVAKVVRETANVVSVYLKPLGSGLSFFPGQFAYITFFSRALPVEEHHFTISNSPGRNEIRMTIKNLGDFTSLISGLRKGDRAVVRGPYGVFSNVLDPGPSLFVAGGIGITPFLSMLDYLKLKRIKKDIVLVYSVGAEEDLVLTREIESSGAKVFYWFTKSQGHLGEEVFLKIPDLVRRRVYLCGPEGMIATITKVLQRLGIPKSRIYAERFALR